MPVTFNFHAPVHNVAETIINHYHNTAVPIGGTNLCLPMTDIEEAEPHEGADEPGARPRGAKETSFRHIVVYIDADALLQRLHQLIDGRRGADVGCVLLRCIMDGYISRRPTQKEFVSEFELIGGWRAIHNYMDDNNMNALDRANKIIIF